MVPRAFFHQPGQLPEWQPAELTLSDLAESTLLLVTAAHRSMRDSERLLSLCLSPPDRRVARDAIDRLVSWGLLKSDDRSATTVGAFVGGLPISLQAGRLVAAGCGLHLMRQAAVLGAIMSTTPLPIVKPFGKNEEYEALLSKFAGQPISTSDQCRALLAQ